MALHGNRYRTLALAEFHAPLELGFWARPHRSIDPDPWSQAPCVTGDPAFDAIFRVSAFDPRLAACALGEARARLCELHEEWRHVEVHDHGVTIRAGRIATAKSLEAMLDAARSAAELVDSRRVQRREPYR